MMASISLDSQTFYDPQSATGRKPINSLRNDSRSAVSPRGQKRLEHDAQDHRRAATGSSPADVILILSESQPDFSEPGEGEFDNSNHNDFDDGHSDISFPSPDDVSTASTSSYHAKQAAVTETVGSHSQESELPPLAAETPRPVSQSVRDSSEDSSVGEMAESSQPSSPVALQTGPSLTKGTENPSGTSLASQRHDTACNVRALDVPGSAPDEDVIGLHGSELWRTAQFSQEHTSGPEHAPAPPAIPLPQRLSGSRAVQQDEPSIEGGASCETRQRAPPEGATCGKNAVQVTLGTSLQVEALGLSGSNLPTVPSSRPENHTHRESMLHRVSISNGNRNDKAMPPCIQPKTSRRRATVRRHHHCSIKKVNNNLDKTQKAKSNEDIRLPPRKCRRVSFRQNISPHQDASGEEVSTSSQDSDSDWVTRLPQGKRRKSSLSKRAHTKATRKETSSDSGGTGSPQVPIANPSAIQPAGEQQQFVKALSTKFSEWLLEATVVRSAIVNGITTFQLQFKADYYCSEHRHHMLNSSQYGGRSMSRYSKQEPIMTVASTPGQAPLVSQSDDKAQPTSPIKKAEWDVEKILKVRKRGRGYQAHVKWVDFEEPTWEPLKNFLKTAALDDYEAQQGNIALALGP